MRIVGRQRAGAVERGRPLYVDLFEPCVHYQVFWPAALLPSIPPGLSAVAKLSLETQLLRIDSRGHRSCKHPAHLEICPLHVPFLDLELPFKNPHSSPDEQALLLLYR